jgi:carbamoyl-phosphate synthase small subunit
MSLHKISELSTFSAVLALEDGSLFWGESIGISGETQGEVVFNTSMTAYQEMLSDPSYTGQILTLTCPHIGNVGTNIQDNESSKIATAGLVIRDLTQFTSNWRSEKSLVDYLIEHQVVAIANIDTRRLTRLLREKGAQNGCILTGNNPDANKALQLAKSFPGLQGADLTEQVSTPQQYYWTEGTFDLGHSLTKTESKKIVFHVVAYDFGIKRNILRLLVDAGCKVTVVPAQTKAQTVLDLNPDGIFLSNGPGDPAACKDIIQNIQILLKSKIPLFGICLGHQLLALAAGAKTIKMKLGHHGANHPVQEVSTGKVFVTTQNHGFAVDPTSLPAEVFPTHYSLFDGTLQGIQFASIPAFSFQGHPEGSGGPHDIRHLFQKFTDMMENK